MEHVLHRHVTVIIFIYSILMAYIIYMTYLDYSMYGPYENRVNQLFKIFVELKFYY